MFSGVFCSISSVKAVFANKSIYIFRWVKKLLFILFQFKADKGFQTGSIQTWKYAGSAGATKAWIPLRESNFQILADSSWTLS